MAPIPAKTRSVSGHASRIKDALCFAVGYLTVGNTLMIFIETQYMDNEYFSKSFTVSGAMVADQAGRMRKQKWQWLNLSL